MNTTLEYSAPRGAAPVELLLKSKPYSPAESLLYYDGPVLMWLDTERSRYLAVALPDDAGPWPFLLVELTATMQAQVEKGEITLRAAYTGVDTWILVPDYGNLDDAVLTGFVLNHAPDSWLPGDAAL